MDITVMIICAVMELHGADWDAFKANSIATAQDVYEAYKAFRNTSTSNTTYCENELWNWYCELTGR